jgi:hypothetical protein
MGGRQGRILIAESRQSPASQLSLIFPRFSEDYCSKSSEIESATLAPPGHQDHALKIEGFL